MLARMATRIRLSFAFLGSTFFSVIMAACATHVVSSSTEPRKMGVACAFDEQCGSGRCSADVNGGGCGVCLDVRKLGESCVGPDEICNLSAACENGVCESKRSLLGASCSVGGKGGDPCDDELYCDRPIGNQGTCVAPVAVGGACELSSSKCVTGAACDESGVCAIPPADSCALHPCGAGTFCDAHQTCRQATLKAGERCPVVNVIHESAENGCALGTVCGKAGFPSLGGLAVGVNTCLPLPVEGELCIHKHCAVGLFCAQKTSGIGLDPPRCEVPRDEGDECNTSSVFHIDCGAGLECRRGVCKRACD
jgi:hypothetical protein